MYRSLDRMRARLCLAKPGHFERGHRRTYTGELPRDWAMGFHSPSGWRRDYQCGRHVSADWGNDDRTRKLCVLI